MHAAWSFPITRRFDLATTRGPGRGESIRFDSRLQIESTQIDWIVVRGWPETCTRAPISPLTTIANKQIVKVGVAELICRSKASPDPPARSISLLIGQVSKAEPDYEGEV